MSYWYLCPAGDARVARAEVSYYCCSKQHAKLSTKQAVRVATRYAPAPLLPPRAPQRLARRRAYAT